jgi:hypothetical protein
MQQWNMKHSISVVTVMCATVEELWESLFSVGLCGGYTWRTETEASQSRES